MVWVEQAEQAEAEAQEVTEATELTDGVFRFMKAVELRLRNKLLIQYREIRL
jgi:hypothetical protein